MEFGKRSLQARMMHLLSEKAKHDVMFVVGNEEKETFGANSLILSAASEAFDRHFYGEFGNPSIENPLIVKIPDGTPEGFRALLEYVYTDRADITHENVNSVLYLAKEYLLVNLYQQAVRFVAHQISVSTVFDYLPMAEFFEELQGKCLAVFDLNAKVLLASNEFLQLNPTWLRRILSRDSLQISEMVIYERTMEWAKENLKRESKEETPVAIRATLDVLLYLIRFPLMDSSAFANGPEAAQILNAEELLDIYRWFMHKQSAGRFNAKPRAGPHIGRFFHPCKDHELRCKNGDCAYFAKVPNLPAPVSGSVCLNEHPSCIYCLNCRKFVPEFAQSLRTVRQMT